MLKKSAYTILYVNCTVRYEIIDPHDNGIAEAEEDEL